MQMVPRTWTKACNVTFPLPELRPLQADILFFCFTFLTVVLLHIYRASFLLQDIFFPTDFAALQQLHAAAVAPGTACDSRVGCESPVPSVLP